MIKHPHIKESIILSLLKKDKEAAISLIYNDYNVAFYSVILRIVKKQEIAQDLLQDSFIKIWKYSEDYDPQKGRLFTWMLNICRNTAIDYTRSKRAKQQSVTVDINSKHSINESNAIFLKVNHLGLDKVINSLDIKYIEILDLFYFQGYTQKEAQEYLGIPLGTVKSRLRLAIKELKKRNQ